MPWANRYINASMYTLPLLSSLYTFLWTTFVIICIPNDVRFKFCTLLSIWRRLQILGVGTVSALPLSKLPSLQKACCKNVSRILQTQQCLILYWWIGLFFAVLNSFVLQFYNTTEGKKVFKSFVDLHDAAFPEYMDELRGIADGANQPFSTVFIMNLLEEMRYAAEISGFGVRKYCCVILNHALWTHTKTDHKHGVTLMPTRHFRARTTAVIIPYAIKSHALMYTMKTVALMPPTHQPWFELLWTSSV